MVVEVVVGLVVVIVVVVEVVVLVVHNSLVDCVRCLFVMSIGVCLWKMKLSIACRSDDEQHGTTKCFTRKEQQAALRVMRVDEEFHRCDVKINA